MINIPDGAKKITVDGATVDFVEFGIDNDIYYAFDTSKCSPPEPMVNAVAGLNLLDADNKKLLMINHKNPGGLIDKIGDDFKIVSSVRSDGLVEVVFTRKGYVDMGEAKYHSTCH